MPDDDFTKTAKVANVLKKILIDKLGKISKNELDSIAAPQDLGIMLTMR